MNDPTEAIRREMLAEINAEPGSRAALEAQHGQVWDTDQLQQEFEVVGFFGPARRRPAQVRLRQGLADVPAPSPFLLWVPARVTGSVCGADVALLCRPRLSDVRDLQWRNAPMPKYEIEQFEIYVLKYRVEANSAAEAIQKLFDGESEPVDEPEYVGTAEDMGLPVEENLGLADDLRALGMSVDDDVIPSICSIKEIE